MKRKILSLAMVFMLSIAMLSGCTKTDNGADTGEPAASTEAKHLVLGETQAVTSLDPAIDWQGWFTVRYAITETLFKLDDNLVPMPWLAESYENVDETTWKITIKENIKFSSGNPLTPEMVVENLKKVGEVNSRAAGFGTSAYEIDGNTITIKTAEPYPTIINDLCDPYSSIVDLEATEDFDKAPIGTGAYVVKDMTEKVSIDLVANENYWEGKPNIPTVQVKFVTDTDTLAMALQSGEVDVAMNLTSDSKATFEADKAYKIEEIATARAYFMYYNLDTMSDMAVRKAVSMSIDKEQMKEFLFEGSVTPAVGAFPMDLPYGGKHLKGATYNIEEAKKVLDEAGYKDSDGDGVLEKDGKPLSLRLVTYKRLKNEAIVTELQSKLKEIGIKAEVTVHEKSEFFKTGEFDIGIYSVVTTAVGDPQAFLNTTFASDGITNFGHFKNAEVDELLEELKHEFDSDKRAELAIAIQQKALDEYAFDNIGFVNMAMYMDSNITGIAPHPTDYYQMNAKMDIN